MAFDFFRRRQKMVIIVMVVLMISFLVGFQGLDSLFSPNPDKIVRGTTPAGEIRFTAIRQAEIDLSILRDRLQLGRLGTEGTLPFLQLYQSGGNAELAFVLLQEEAQKRGITVSEAEVDIFLRQMGLGGAEMQKLLNDLALRESRIGLREIRHAVHNWLQVQKGYESIRVSAPPSEQELKHLYRETREAIGLQVVRVPAERFIDKVAEPAAEEIRKQFETFRDVAPKTYPTAESFGFGYRQPDRVNLEWLLISREAVRRGTQPSEDEILRYFEDHRDQFTKEVPLAAAPTTAPTTEPARTQTVRKTLREALDEVVEAVTRESVEATMTAMISSLEAEVAKAGASEAARAAAYGTVVANMTQGPDSELVKSILAREVPKAAAEKIKELPLEKAIADLASAVRLKAIAYPFGPQGEYNVDPQVKVTLQPADKLTLGQALEQITQKVFGPVAPATQPATAPATKPATAPATKPADTVKIQWAAFPRLRTGDRDVLYPVSPAALKLFPVSTGSTGMVDRQELAQHAVLGFATTGATMMSGQFVPMVAFQVLASKDAKGALRVGEDKRAFVFGSQGGQALWRVTEAKAAYAPETIDAVPGLREQIVRDLKIQKAFEQAKAMAKDIASKPNIEEAAKAANLTTFQTEAFTRRVITSPLQQAQQRASMFRQGLSPEMFLTKPYEFAYAAPQGVPLPTEDIRKMFMQEAFELAPKDIEPPAGGYPKPGPAKALPLPSDQAALAIQRIDYRPPVVGEFEDRFRASLAGAILALREWTTRTEWFNFANIAKRTGFQDAPDYKQTPKDQDVAKTETPEAE